MFKEQYTYCTSPFGTLLRNNNNTGIMYKPYVCLPLADKKTDISYCAGNYDLSFMLVITTYEFHSQKVL